MPAREVLVANLVALEVAERCRVALETAGIPTILLKGAAYLETLYPDLSTRPMSDVDVLIPKVERERAECVLVAAGFERLEPPPGRAVSYPSHYNWPFLYPGPIPVVVEVHVELSQPQRYAIDYDGIWTRRVIRQTASRTVPTLAAEDALLHVVIHDAKSWYAVGPHQRTEDVRRILACWHPDWRLVVERARTWGLAAAAFVTLQIASASGVPVPASVIEALAPGWLRGRLLRALVDLDRGAPRIDVNHRPQQLAITLATDSGWQLVRFLSTYAGKRLGDLLR